MEIGKLYLRSEWTGFPSAGLRIRIEDGERYYSCSQLREKQQTDACARSAGQLLEKTDPFNLYSFIERIDTTGKGELLEALRDVNFPAFV